MYNTILFDLDGTLTDPGLGITNAVAHALQKMGRPVPPREQLYKYIGPPLLDSFEGFEGMTPAEALGAGEVGYFTASIKTISDPRVGDTVTGAGRPAAAHL